MPPPLGEASDGIAASLVAPLLLMAPSTAIVIFDLAHRVSPNAIQEALWLADEVIVAHGGADRLQQKAKTASALQERERLAREMHDAAMQSIYSITLFAEAGRRLASLGQIDRVQEYLQQLNETAQLALKELAPSALRIAACRALNKSGWSGACASHWSRWSGAPA